MPFPETLTPLAVGQERSVQLVNDVLGGNRMLVMVASRDGEIENPGPDDLYGVGVAGHGRADDQGARRHAADPGPRRPARGARRVRPDASRTWSPRSTELPDVVEPSPELEALFRNVQSTFSQIIEEVPYLPEELQIAVANLEDPAELAHMIAGALRIKTEERQELLEERDVAKRLRRLSELLARELELISIGTKIQSQVESEIEKGQREYFLRQQLKAIQEELGEVDEAQAEAAELREQIEAANLPEHALEAGRARAPALRAAAAAVGRARRDPRLPRVDRRRCRGRRAPRTTSTSRRRARRSTATTTTSRR